MGFRCPHIKSFLIVMTLYLRLFVIFAFFIIVMSVCQTFFLSVYNLPEALVAKKQHMLSRVILGTCPVLSLTIPTLSLRVSSPVIIYHTALGTRSTSSYIVIVLIHEYCTGKTASWSPCTFS